MMTSPKKDENDAKTPPTPQDSDVLKAVKTSEDKRELTDEEIAAVAGGGGKASELKRIDAIPL
jgi:hypothetical protein